MTVPPSALARLAHKYETLGALRRARAAGEPIPERRVFKVLAREFPGALAELDTLPLETIDERAAALAQAALGGSAEPWMEWFCGYHAVMRAVLRVKGRLARARDIPDALAEELAVEATGIAGARIDADMVRAIARPPGGRLSPLVFAHLARSFGAAPEEIAGALFPGRRGRRPPP